MEKPHYFQCEGPEVVRRLLKRDIVTVEKRTSPAKAN
jgi:hypothetical protein